MIMPNLNSLIGGLANVANHLQGSRQGKGDNSSNPTPNQGGSGYPSQGNSAYPNQGNSGYPNQGNSAYPNQGNSGYPNQGNSGYPNQGNSGYPNQGNNGYPNQSGSNYTGYGGNTGGPQAYQGYGGIYGNGQRFDGAPSPPTQGGYPPLMPTQGDYRPLMPSQQSYGSTPQPGYPSQPSFGGGNNSPYPASNSVPYPTTDVGPGGFAPSPPIGYGAQPNAYGSPPSQGYGPPQNQYPYPNLGQNAQQQPSAPPQYQSAYAPQMWNNPSIRPASGFNANADAELLRKAMKGLGCNNSKVVAVLCGRSNWQRQEIAKAFKVMYGKDLIKELKGELSGDFEDLIMALMEPPARYDAEQLHKAMAGLGTKESVLIEIMTTRTNAQIQELKMTYKQMYGHDLERDLIGETSGHFKRLLVSLCAGGRNESNYTDPLKANQDARNLYRAGEQRLGTDESCFNAILASQNMYQLRMVFDEYQKVTKHSIEKAIESEFSGDIRDGLLAVVKSIRYRPAYFAELLNNSMKGFGTRDNDLIRLVVTRAEIDLRDIQQSYHQLYKTSLENAIAGDCSGAYKEGLIALVKGNY